VHLKYILQWPSLSSARDAPSIYCELPLAYHTTSLHCENPEYPVSTAIRYARDLCLYPDQCQGFAEIGLLSFWLSISLGASLGDFQFARACPHRGDNSTGGTLFNVVIRNRRGCCKRQSFTWTGNQPKTPDSRPSTLSTKPSLHLTRVISLSKTKLLFDEPTYWVNRIRWAEKLQKWLLTITHYAFN